ncbi:STAS-like domain-containing protein [Xanthomonas euvesicatoria]
MTSQTMIDIGRDFSVVPSGRYPEDDDFNGQTFREDYLVPALRRFERVQVSLDNTEGFGSSFLEEAFGGLVRVNGMAALEIRKKLELIATSPSTQRYRDKIWQYISAARFEPKMVTSKPRMGP